MCHCRLDELKMNKQLGCKDSTFRAPTAIQRNHSQQGLRLTPRCSFYAKLRRQPITLPVCCRPYRLFSSRSNTPGISTLLAAHRQKVAEGEAAAISQAVYPGPNPCVLRQQQRVPLFPKQLRYRTRHHGREVPQNSSLTSVCVFLEYFGSTCCVLINPFSS